GVGNDEIFSSVRIESVMPFNESPETPYIRLTPAPIRVSTSTSATRAITTTSRRGRPPYTSTTEASTSRPVPNGPGQICRAVGTSRGLGGTHMEGSIPQQMKAAVLDKYGGPEVLPVATLPVPTPGAGEILIRLESAGIGVWDADVRSGEFEIGERKFPKVIGNDG